MSRVHRLPIKTTVFAGIIILLAAALVVTLSIRLASASCDQEYRDDENIVVSGEVLRVQLADTSAEINKGLGGKSCIADNQAMLFELGRASEYSFWMKDMKFPIDIIWINSKHEIVQVDAAVSPGTYPKAFASAQPAQFVLELKSGRAADLGLRPGGLVDL